MRIAVDDDAEQKELLSECLVEDVARQGAHATHRSRLCPHLPDCGGVDEPSVTNKEHKIGG